MPPTSAAMELKVLISILQSGTALQTLLAQTNQLSQALTQLQQQAGGGPGAAAQQVASGIGQVGKTGDEAAKQMMTLNTAIGQVTSALKFLAGGFLALQSVRFIKDLADTAARAEVLQTTLHVVAVNAGILTEDIDKLDASVQAMGITASSSRQSLVQMMQAKLDVAWAPKLARAAQDLAVVSGMNSSATFQRLILNIQQLDALGLRWMGIMVSREEAEQRYATANNVTVKSLSRRQSVEAFMIETMRKLTDLEGAYAAAMGDVGKQLASLERLTETLKKTLGDALLPVYSALVRELSLLFEELTVISEVTVANLDGMKEMADVVSEWGASIREWIRWALDHRELIIDLIQKAIILKAVILAFRLINWVGSGALAFLQFLLRTTLALQALRSGQISYTAALTIFEAKSYAAAKAQLDLALAQAAAARSAQGATIAQTGLQAGVVGTTAAVGALRLAWMGLASFMAIPIIGIVIARKQEEKATGEMPFWEQVEKAQEKGPPPWNWEYWWNSVTGAPDPVTKQNRLRAMFGQWQRDNQELVRDIERSTGEKPSAVTGLHSLALPHEMGGAVEAAFRFEEQRQIALKEQNKALEANFQVYDKIQEQRARIATFDDVIKKNALETTTAELDFAEKQKAAAQAELVRLQEVLRGRKASEAELAEGRVIALLRERRDVEIKVGKGDFGTEAAEKAALKDVSERLQRARDALKLALATAPEKTPEQREQAKRASDLRLARIEREALEEAARKGTQQLLGGKFDFSSGQKQLAAFTQGAKAVRDQFELVQQVQGQIAEGGEDQKAHEERLGVLRAEQAESFRALSTKVTKGSLDDFRELVAEYEKTTGDVRTSREVLKTAEEAARKEALEDNKGNIERAKELINLRTEAGIQGAKREQDTIKTLMREEGRLNEEHYANNLITMDQYYKTRRRIILQEGDAELKVQDAVINRLELLRDAETDDPEARQRAQDQLNAALDQRRAINQKIEGDLADTNKAERDATREIVKEIITGQKDYAAAVGGMVAELQNLNFQMDEQAKKFRALGGEQGAQGLQLVEARRLAGTFDILRKNREIALQLELDIESALQGQLDLAKAQQATGEARLARQVQAGAVPEDVAQRIRNQTIFADIARNRAQQESEQRKLAAQQRSAAIEQARLPQELLQKGVVDPFVIFQRSAELFLKNKQAITATEIAIANLATEYENLQGSVESYGKTLQESFVQGFSDAITTTLTDFKNAGDAWVSLSKSISNQIVSVFVEAFTQRLFAKVGLFTFVDQLMNKIFGARGGGKTMPAIPGLSMFAGGGPVIGPGTGTSDSVIARVSAGEHIMPAVQASRWMPLLEGIRMGTIAPAFALGGVVGLQSIADLSLIPRRYANGGVVVSDGGASQVTPGGGGAGNMVVTMHPDTLNMTMREWLEHEVVRQQGRR